jgi:hypothetical protein
MKMGTDISLATCRSSGYMVMEYPKGLIKKGILDKDRPVLLTVSNPEAWTDCGRVKPPVHCKYQDSYERHEPLPSIYALDEEYSWNDLIEFISDFGRRQSIASCCDWEHCQPNFDNPTERDLLNLASDINCCYSLATS